MDILFVLIPLSVLMALVVLGGLWWAIYRGQFEDIEDEGRRIFEEDKDPDDDDETTAR
jgi:cbb3-type cytochrome oxidase maturation protein